MYLTGARQRPRMRDEWNSYDRALMLRMDEAGAGVRTAVEYVSPPDVCAAKDPAINFKSASIRGNLLYVSTNTEVLIYEVPDFRLAGYLSLPWFNDVHHVCPSRDGHLLVASTGLDMVAEVTLEGRTVREWPVLDEPIWSRFSRETDYRKIPTTKPHQSHPNSVIEIGSDVWVSRAHQKDVRCLTQPGKRVGFHGMSHDGVRYNGKLYFTTLNGFIHILDERSMVLEETIDLNPICGRKVDLGWMRGILPLDGGLCWVGFTRLRPTKFQENLTWLRYGSRHYHLPTRLASYDLTKRLLIKEVNLEPYDMHAVFSILPEVGAQG